MLIIKLGRGRPRRPRQIRCEPATDYFKPRGIPLRLLEEVVLELEEVEAIRLADGEGLYQVQAARLMGVSRQTFANILDSAHRKLAEVLLHGKALRIDRQAVGSPSVAPTGRGNLTSTQSNKETSG